MAKDPSNPNNETDNNTKYDPYQAWRERRASQQDRVFKASTSLALDTDPDEAARQKHVAEKLGWPVAAVQALPEEAERASKIAAIERDTAKAPALRRAFTDADFAKAAHDDTAALSRVANALTNIGRSAKAGAYDIVSSGAGLMEAGYKLQAESASDPLIKNMLLMTASHFERWRKDWAASAENVAGDQSDLGSIERGVNAGIRSMSQMLPGLIASVLTRSPTAALTLAGISAGSPSATKALDAGKSPWSALAFGGRDAAIEIATEAIPIASLLKNLKIGAPLYKVIARQIATEVPTELLATTLQNFNEWATLHPDKPFSDYLDELPEALQQTFIAATTMATITGGFGKGVSAIAHRTQQNYIDVERANQGAETLASLNEAAAAAKVLQRDPETFKGFIAQATEDGPVQNVFINAKTLMQSGIADQVAALSPAVASQLEEALQTGGQIAIPIEEYATYIAPTEHAKTLLSHLKTDAEGFSQAEAQAYMQNHAEQMQVEVERALAKQEVDVAFQQSSEQVRNTIKAQLGAAKRFTPQVNETYSALVGSFFAVQAGRIGTTPEALYEQYPLKVATEQLDAQQAENLTIPLLNNANLSDMLRKSGNFFLHTHFDIAAQLQQATDGPTDTKLGKAQLIEDADVLLNWFGVKSLQDWNTLGLDGKRSHHEKFAKAFEAYLFEGKAPSIEMQGIFQRFRDWLLSIYKHAKSLNAELNPAVRGVFDRMLATGEQIALAEQSRGLVPLFTSPEQAGMTLEQFAAYKALDIGAINAAIQAVQASSLRDTQWLHDAKGRTVKKLKKESKTLRDDMLDSVAQEVMAQPIYRAWQFLTGDLATEENPLDTGRLDINALSKLELPPEIINVLKARRMVASNGSHPDFVAERFGFTSGDELARKLAEATPPMLEISRLTDQRMLERHGELASPEAIERAADQAIHNSVRARFLATEANALAKAAGQQGVLAKAAYDHAKEVIAKLKIRDIRPSQYANNEARAAQAADQAKSQGDNVTAANEKRNQLIQHYATRAAYTAQDEVENGLAYFRRLDSVPRTLDADYADQINQLLERFDLRKSQTLKAVDRRTALAEWLKSQREADVDDRIPRELKNEAFRTSYKNLTVEEFRDLVDAVRLIERLGRLKHKLLIHTDQRNIQEVRDSLRDSLREYSRGRTATSRTPATTMGRSWQAVKRFWYAHIKVATWARIMDGGKDGGAMWKYIVNPANNCANNETTMRAAATAKLSEILAPVLKNGKMGGKGKFFAGINRSLNRQERIAIALNTGNASNLQRMLGGEGWTAAQLDPVLQSLTAQEWQAVQGVWDYFETYWPLIEAKERRIYGVAPRKVPLQPFEIVTADGVTMQMRGGYYPVKYDPAASQRAEEHADAESARRQLQGSYTAATTRRTFTKARAEEVTGRPLLYTLSGVYSGINDIIHDLSWHEWLIDTNRLLRSHEIDSAIREYYGPEVMRQFKSWVADIAEGERGAEGAVDEVVSRLRQGVSLSALGFNLTTAIIQPLGITQSMSRIGTKWVGRGLEKYTANPIELTREVLAKSKFMAHRALTRFRELNELRNAVQDQNTFKQWIGRYAYVPMMKCQQMVDIPTWWGAYEKATAAGANEANAIAMADQAVIDSQGGGQLKDLSAIERGGWTKIFTVFYSFSNTTLNLGVEKVMTADTPAKKAMLLVEAIRLHIAPTMLAYFIKAALTGDDDAWEDLPEKLIANQLESLMSHMVVVRELRDLPSTLFGLNHTGRSYTGPTGLRVIQDAYKFASQAHQLEFDEAFWKASVNLLGTWYGLPSVQINRAITGAVALYEGDTDNPAALLFGHKKVR